MTSCRAPKRVHYGRVTVSRSTKRQIKMPPHLLMLAVVGAGLIAGYRMAHRAMKKRAPDAKPNVPVVHDLAHGRLGGRSDLDEVHVQLLGQPQGLGQFLHPDLFSIGCHDPDLGGPDVAIHTQVSDLASSCWILVSSFPTTEAAREVLPRKGSTTGCTGPRSRPRRTSIGGRVGVSAPLRLCCDVQTTTGSAGALFR